MLFIGRKNLNRFKVILVSPSAEKILLLIYCFCIPYIAFYPITNIKFNEYEIKENVKTIFNNAYVKKSSHIEDIYS